MMDAKISQEHDNMHHINNNYALKSIYDDENECINDMLSFINKERTNTTQGAHAIL